MIEADGYWKIAPPPTPSEGGEIILKFSNYLINKLKNNE